jgi:hypothetical protein
LFHCFVFAVIVVINIESERVKTKGVTAIYEGEGEYNRHDPDFAGISPAHQMAYQIFD